MTLQQLRTRPSIKRIGNPILTAPSEKELEHTIAAALEPHFHVARQVTGTHVYGQRVIADLIIAPREPWGGGSSRLPIAVELKRENRMASAFGAVGQALDYTMTQWDRFPEAADTPPDGRTLAAVVGIALKPGAAEQPTESPVIPWDMQHLLGRLNIAVISHERSQGWIVRFCGERQWSQHRGMRGGGWKAAVKVGSR